MKYGKIPLMLEKKKFKVTNIILIAIYIAIGLTAIILAATEYKATKRMLGLFILSGMMPHFVGFVGNKKDRLLGALFCALFLSSFVIGLIAIFAKNLTIETVCVMFGILDICRGIAEILMEIRKNFNAFKDPLMPFEMFISFGDIIFGIFLIIRKVDSIYAHIIYLGVALILMAVLRLLRLVKHD